MYNFRDKLNVSSHEHFGVEIEFEGPTLEDVYKELSRKKIPSLLSLSHKKDYCDFNKWIIDIDDTVSRNNANGSFYGGEVSSKILSNTISDWKELKKVCESLQKLNAEATDLCSSHITVDVSDVKDYSLFFETLFKIIIIYENEISTFLMGDNYLVRSLKNDYAANVAPRLAKKINHIDFKNPNSLRRLMLENECCLCGRDGINISKFESSSVIEFRYPNGTLNAETIQNNINFLLCLLEAIKKKKFDIKELSYIVNNKIQFSLLDKSFDNDVSRDNFNELIKIISKDEVDETYFDDQFQYILSTKK